MHDRDDQDLETFLKDPDTRHERVLLGSIVFAVAAVLAIVAALILLNA